MQYKVYLDNVLKDTINLKTIKLTDLKPNTTYSVAVSAFNGVKESTKAALQVTTLEATTKLTLKNQKISGSQKLKYQEYSLGLIALGTEPDGMFGGGNEQEVTVTGNIMGTDTIFTLPSSIKMADGTLTQQQDGTYAYFDGYKAIYWRY